MGYQPMQSLDDRWPYVSDWLRGLVAHATKMEPLLDVRNLEVSFNTARGNVRAVRGVSFSIFPGQTLAIVGESGCGKSVTSLSVLRLIPSPPGKVLGGEIVFNGQDLLKADERHLRAVRGGEIAMIFQEPMTSLNPVYTVGDQIVEAITLHQHATGSAARKIAEKAMADVGIADPARRMDTYPHQLSGGMRQRIMIAMALSCEPELLVADEPTTALDVTIQAQILDLLRKLQGERKMAIQLITHDLGVVAENADTVAVMYAGRVVEFADVEPLFDGPAHPYTAGLLRSVPRLGSHVERLETIAGNVPNPADLPSGCKFHPRCDRTREFAKEGDAVTITIGGEPVALKRPCVETEPELRETTPGHWCACHYAAGYATGQATTPRSSHRRAAVGPAFVADA